MRRYPSSAFLCRNKRLWSQNYKLAADANKTTCRHLCAAADIIVRIGRDDRWNFVVDSDILIAAPRSGRSPCQSAINWNGTEPKISGRFIGCVSFPLSSFRSTKTKSPFPRAIHTNRNDKMSDRASRIGGIVSARKTLFGRSRFVSSENNNTLK